MTADAQGSATPRVDERQIRLAATSGPRTLQIMVSEGSLSCVTAVMQSGMPERRQFGRLTPPGEGSIASEKAAFPSIARTGILAPLIKLNCPLESCGVPVPAKFPEGAYRAGVPLIEGDEGSKNLDRSLSHAGCALWDPVRVPDSARGMVFGRSATGYAGATSDEVSPYGSGSLTHGAIRLPGRSARP